jgi:hypothetical protein
MRFDVPIHYHPAAMLTYVHQSEKVPPRMSGYLGQFGDEFVHRRDRYLIAVACNRGPFSNPTGHGSPHIIVRMVDASALSTDSNLSWPYDVHEQEA